MPATMSKLVGMMRDFYANRSNPHEVNAEQLNSFSKEKTDEIFSGRLLKNTLPLSRYGSLDWLPVVFQGSFGGATRSEQWWPNVVLMEDTGRIVGIINATNGIVSGAYYSVIDVADDGTISKHTPTATEYLPAYIRGLSEVQYVRTGNAKGVIWGHLTKEVKGCRDFICLSNGTLNADVHNGAFLNVPDAPNGRGISGGIFAQLCGSHVYLVNQIVQAGMPIMDVWRIPVAEIKDGNVVTPEHISNWVTRGITQTYTEEYIRIAGVYGNSTGEGDPMFIYPEGNNANSDVLTGSLTMLGMDANSEGTEIRCNVGSFKERGWNGNTYQIYYGFSIVFNPEAGTAYIDEEYRQPSTVSYPGVAPGVAVSGPFSQNASNLAAGRTGQPHNSYWVAEDGSQLFSTGYGNENAGEFYSAKGDLGVSSAFEFWNPAKRNISGKVKTLTHKRFYSSTVGDGLQCPFYYNKTTMFIRSVVATGVVYPKVPISGVPDYTYETFNQGNLLGYEPTNRGKVNRHNYVGCIYADENDNVSCKGGLFWTGWLSSYVSIDENNVPQGSFTLKTGVLESIISQARTMVANPEWTDSHTAVASLLVFENASVPCIASVTIGKPGSNSSEPWRIYVFSCDTDVRAGEVGTATLRQQIYTVGGTTTIRGLPTPGGDQSYCYPMLYRNNTEKFWAICYTTPHGIQTGGVSRRNIFMMKRDTDPDWDVSTKQERTWSAWYFGINQILFAPGIGICCQDGDKCRASSGTAYVVGKYGYGYDELKEWKNQGSYILVSQKVPAGWNIYVTDTIPVMVYGALYDIAPQNFNLSEISADPRNKKFLVYVEVVDGEAKHVITENELPSAVNRLYVGYLTTNDTQLVGMYVLKGTYIGDTILSSILVGNAIPISSGTPDQSSVFPW